MTHAVLVFACQRDAQSRWGRKLLDLIVIVKAFLFPPLPSPSLSRSSRMLSPMPKFLNDVGGRWMASSLAGKSHALSVAELTLIRHKMCLLPKPYCHRNGLSVSLFFADPTLNFCPRRQLDNAELQLPIPTSPNLCHCNQDDDAQPQLACFADAAAAVDIDRRSTTVNLSLETAILTRKRRARKGGREADVAQWHGATFH